MPLSWNEIKSRAFAFSNEWKDEVNEHAEAKSFWDDFFNIFGISRRRVATFEQQVKKIDNRQGYIDLLWKGHILIEHKSRGKNLEKAYKQAKDYFPGLTEKELPRYILVSDFEKFHLYDLEENVSHEFTLNNLADHVHLFGFIAGYEKRTYKEQDPVNIEAAQLMGRLHDKLNSIGYSGHYLELYLVRLLFCLFADDTNIFEKGIFQEYVDLHTREDGSDLAARISQLFQVLNTPVAKRFTNLEESLAVFPYVNGKLFEEQLPTASFDSDMRTTLLRCSQLDWGKISPAIFGSLFQSVMNPVERRNLGAHYTSEKNILKLIKPLFLDELWKEFEQAKNNDNRLKKLHHKISQLRFLDPACGCGNFLIIAYRELRMLEMEIVKRLLKNQTVTGIDHYFLLDVDRFYGIEYEEFPAQIAQVAMWLIDHQMNMLASETFGEYYARLPLKKSATIVHGNALRTDWQSLIDPLPWEKGTQKYDYIFGNPPFVGKTWQNAEQKEDMELIFNGVKGSGVMDYVAAWYLKAAKYLKETSHIFKHEGYFNIEIEENFTLCAFVSTNSISQGEQVGVLWNELFSRYHIKIFFAHRTFKWGNEARGNAAVHVVIIGFANFNYNPKSIYGYEDIKGEAHEINVKNINPYLIDGKDQLILRRSLPICNVPKMIWGNKPVEGGHLIFTPREKDNFLKIEPLAEKYFKRFVGGQEFIQGKERWCLWLVDVKPDELRRMKHVVERIELVKDSRLKSKDIGARRLADRPTQFRDLINPESFIAVPEVSSERRRYIPIGFLNSESIASNKLQMVPGGNIWHFGVLTSLMHMTWVRYVCGRMKSDYSYSNTIVYNNFPWPENPTEKQKATVESAAQHVLDIRATFPESSLADLYDPNTMPPALVKAHQALDKAVDLCYRPQPFVNETKRIEYLFELYDRYTRGMFGGGGRKEEE